MKEKIFCEIVQASFLNKKKTLPEEISVRKPWPDRLTKIINYLNYLAASDWLQTPA